MDITLGLVLTACGDPTPPATPVHPHYACSGADTDGAFELEVPLPFGDTGLVPDGATSSIETGGAPTGSSAGDAESSTSGANTTGVGETGRLKPALGLGRQQSQPSPATRICSRDATPNDRVLSESLAKGLPYCFGEFTSTELEAALRDAFPSETWAYELTADINFVHREDLDGPNCAGALDVLTIREIDSSDCGSSGCPLALAFFPNEDGTPPNGDFKIAFSPLTLENPQFEFQGTASMRLGIPSASSTNTRASNNSTV